MRPLPKKVSVGFRFLFVVIVLGFRPGVLPSPPYTRVCVSVAVSQSTENLLASENVQLTGAVESPI